MNICKTFIERDNNYVVRTEHLLIMNSNMNFC